MRNDGLLQDLKGLLPAIRDRRDEIEQARNVPQDLINRAATIQAAETTVAVTRTCNLLAGGSSIYATSSLQRHARDAEAITHHFTVAPHTWEDAGRVFLGREPTAPLF